MADSDIETLFVDWWNFPGSMEDPLFGPAKSLQEVTGESRETIDDLSVPFLSAIIKKTAHAKLRELDPDDSGDSGGRVSLLDRYLLSQSSLSGFTKFENALKEGARCFLLSLESGKEISGTLADLCAVRMAGIIGRRPSPIFYDENYQDALGPSFRPAGTVGSPQLWLPTKTGFDARSNALSESIVPGVPLFLYFLSGNYLPDLHGYLPPTTHTPEQWGNSVINVHGSQAQEETTPGRPAIRSGKARRPLWQPVRLGLLACVFVSRQIMPSSPRFLRRPFLIIDRLSQPWRGNSFLSRRDQLIFRAQSKKKEVSRA